MSPHLRHGMLGIVFTYCRKVQSLGVLLENTGVLAEIAKPISIAADGPT